MKYGIKERNHDAFHEDREAMVSDLTTRLNRLADAVPDAAPRLHWNGEHWEMEHGLGEALHDSTAHALWGWSILTWLAGRSSVKLLNQSVLFGAVKSKWHQGPTLLEAALSAAEAVAGIQQQETSDAE